MKPSFKTTSLIAAIGMIVYSIYVIVHYVLSELGLLSYHNDLWHDIYPRLIFDIPLLSLIAVCCGLWRRYPSKDASKSFRIFTICLLTALMGTLLFSDPYTIHWDGFPYLYPSIYWRITILLSGIVWLFMLLHQPMEESSPRSYRVTLIIAIAMLSWPMICEALSAISCLHIGHVIGFSSGAIKSWMRWIAPILPLTHFVFPQIKDLYTTRNSHCTPGSFDERSFRSNRAITLTLLAIGFLAYNVDSCCSIAHSVSLFNYGSFGYSILDGLGNITLAIMFLSIPLTWIMLSIMAFRQLPNPRGYKVFNIVCQILTWSSMLLGFLTDTGNMFWMLFFITSGTFFLTTSIRVISYSLPEHIQSTDTNYHH